MLELRAASVTPPMPARCEPSQCPGGVGASCDSKVALADGGGCDVRQVSLLLTTYYLLPTTYYLLPTTYYLLPTTCDLLLTTHIALHQVGLPASGRAGSAGQPRRFAQACMPNSTYCLLLATYNYSLYSLPTT